MLLCFVCNDEIFDNDDIKCVKCKVFLHFSCAGLREGNFRKLSAANKEKWCCSKCKDNIYAANTEISNEIELTKENDGTCSNKILLGLKDSVNFMSKQFDDFTVQLRDLLKEVKEVRAENKLLAEKNHKLESEMGEINKKINFIDQKFIENHVEIIGVPEEENENCSKIVETISKVLGESSSVEHAYRMRSKFQNKNTNGKIVAVLNSYKSKKTLMDLARKKKLKTKDINSKWNNEGVYLNNHLTHVNKTLFYKTRMYAKEHNFRYVWFRDCKIFLRKDENNKAIIIEDETSLNNIFRNI